LPKVFKFHETKKSNAFSNKLSRRKAFPLTLIILGAAIGLIGFIFGIGYLSEKRNDSRPIEPPEAKKVKPVKKKNTLLSTLSIFFWVLSVALIIIPLAFLIILELNFLSFLILIYFLVAAAISASIALVFAIINYFVKKSKEKSQFKNSE
jgi:MFS family permease